ncbi:MAG: putative Ig domain-containing protein, partial [Pseudomonadota bacterium]
PDQAINEDTAWSFTVPANTFSDIDVDTLSYSASLSNDNALPSWVSFNAASRKFSGTPPANYNGTLSLKVTASDGSETASDTFNLTINPINDAPVLVAAIADKSMYEDTTWNYTVPANTFTDVETSNLTYSARLSNGNALPSWLSFNATSRKFSGRPPVNFWGSYTIQVRASDGALIATDTFKLTVNRRPVTPGSKTFTANGQFTVPYYNSMKIIVRGNGGTASKGEHRKFLPRPPLPPILFKVADGVVGLNGSNNTAQTPAGHKLTGNGGGGGPVGSVGSCSNASAPTGTPGTASGGSVNVTGGGAPGEDVAQQDTQVGPDLYRAGCDGGAGGRAEKTFVRGQSGAPNVGQKLTISVGSVGVKGNVVITWN